MYELAKVLATGHPRVQVTALIIMIVIRTILLALSLLGVVHATIDNPGCSCPSSREIPSWYMYCKKSMANVELYMHR
jgi:hypothetical protein